MLDREYLISRLVARGPGEHDQLFKLRGELRRLSLPALAQRFEKETGENAYDASDAAAKEQA